MATRAGDADEAALRHLLNGTQLNNRKEWAAAIEELTTAIDLAPRFVDAYIQRGKAYQQSGLARLALDDLDQAILLDPVASVALYLAKGRLLTGLGSLDQAIGAYSLAIDIDSQNTGVYIERGRVYLQARRLQDAIGNFSSAVSIDPEELEAPTTIALW